jgi:hypothetical protein
MRGKHGARTTFEMHGKFYCFTVIKQKNYLPDQTIKHPGPPAGHEFLL